MKLLGISGSLRAASLNTTLLRAARTLALRSGIEFEIFTGLGELPLFNPDRESEPSLPVDAFRRAVRSADGVLVASPEYAHGVSGVIKNALDWIVGSGELSGKPVAAFNASRRAHIAHQALIETVRTMDARIVREACVTVPLTEGEIDETILLADPDRSFSLSEALRHFERFLRDARQPGHPHFEV